MKLSDYIRKGCEMTAEARATFVTERNGRVCACALGAALVAKEGLKIAKKFGALIHRNTIYEVFAARFPEIKELIAIPGYKAKDPTTMQPLYTGIILLMDVHNWSRERIADYLAERGF